MCLIALALGQHPRFEVVLAANRDEFYERPSAPLQWWDHGPVREAVLAGRDLRAGGHWLALGRHGRVAALTNIRRPERVDPRAPSRGAIVHGWVTAAPAGPGDPSGAGLDGEAYARQLALRAYPGFNLLAGALGPRAADDRWWALRHGRPQARALDRGLYGLSNADLDTPWPKLSRLKDGVARRLAVGGHSPADLAESLLSELSHADPPADHELPDTGIGLERERALGSVFIHAPSWRYGTRCSTVLLVGPGEDGRRRVWVWERTWGEDGRPAGTVHESVALSAGPSELGRAGAPPSTASCA